MANTKFKILSIDGGGIRGILPAMFLANPTKSQLETSDYTVSPHKSTKN